MRLLLLTIDFPPAPGGVQNLLGHLAGGLTPAWQVTVLAPAAAGDAAWDRTQPYTVVRSRPRVGGTLSLVGLQARALLEILRRRPQVIVCGHVLLGPWCRVVSALLRVPYVAMAYAYEIRSPRMRAIARVALRGARRVVTLSEFSRRAVEAHGIAPESITVIRPGAAVEVEAAGSGADETEAPGARVLLSVGRLVDAYKGHDMVIRAMPLILARVPMARYVVVGDGPLRRHLERLCVSLGVSPAIRFVGQASDAAVDRWYRRCEVFVLAGRESGAGGGEGFGMVLVEANLRGKPVVGGRSGGIPDAVIDGQTGILVDPLDPADIADAVTRLLTEPELAARLGRDGRRRALDELTWPRYTEQFARLLTQVVAG
jgi:phosphatidyl-myo-inositol dimannoside synthase